MEKPQGLGISSLFSNWQGSRQRSTGTCPNTVGCSDLANSTMVSRPARTSVRDSSGSPLQRASFEIESRPPTPAVGVGIAEVSRLDVIRAQYRERGFPEKEVALLLEATRSTTRAAYQSAWNIWRNW